MRKFFMMFTLAMVAFMGVSCSEIDLSGKWTLVSVGDETVEVMKDMPVPFISFDAEKGRVHGNAGVNLFNGSYLLNGRKVSFGELVTTMMSGPEESMNLESQVLSSLGRTESVKISGDELKLLSSDGTTLLVYKKN